MPQTITSTRESPLTLPTSARNATTSLSAATLARLIRGKHLSPVEVIDAYLMQIERFNPAINAFSHIDAEGARAAARES
jgi:aspartyl-tRNA(Asn)/glutamyl-tRNA(Gln) amidotransferase subunit A